MERVDSIMERLGFNKEADDGTKAAFIKNLIKQAYGVDVKVPAQYELLAKEKALHTMEDLGRDALAGKKLPQRQDFAAKKEKQEKAVQLSFDLEPPKVG